MKRLVAASLACVSLLATPSLAFDPRILAPSPLSIALTVGRWLQKDSVETFYLKVRAQGKDENDALNQAFRLAVNQAIGSLVVSETQVAQGDVLRNEIINYSSGYIHDFKILDRQQVSGGTQIEIDVWVRKSQIADRVLNRSQAAGQVEGGKISQQIQSLEHERKSGNRLLDAVLRDFPGRAFDVTAGNTKVIMDHDRRPVLQVPVSLKWSSSYVSSLTEVIIAINQNRACASWLWDCRAQSVIKIGSTRAGFDDGQAYDSFYHVMISERPQISMKIYDTSNRARIHKCYSIKHLDHTDWAPWRYADAAGGLFQVHPDRELSFNLILPLSGPEIRDLDRAEVTVVPFNQCPGNRQAK